MLFTEMQNRLLAILFAGGAPVEGERLEAALELTAGELRQHMEALSALINELELPFELRRLDKSYQLISRPLYGELVRRTLEMGRSTPLSGAALEVLAVVAYNQPVTRAFIEQVRGVDSSGVVSSLAEKGLLEEAGRLELPGRPIAYRTTPVFLRAFGLESLKGLPEVDSLSEEVRQAPEAEDDGQLDFSSIN